MANTFLVVKCEVEGIHCWPDCPLSEVQYLTYRHRHRFVVRVKFPVEGDRAIEFIVTQHWLRRLLHDHFWSEELGLHDFGGRSCEAIASTVLNEMKTAIAVSVFEDDENGAEVWRS